jgi:hypothetical protein
VVKGLLHPRRAWFPPLALFSLNSRCSCARNFADCIVIWKSAPLFCLQKHPAISGHVKKPFAVEGNETQLNNCVSKTLTTNAHDAGSVDTSAGSSFVVVSSIDALFITANSSLKTQACQVFCRTIALP